jgi:predicted O-methyltransferase YrrM
LCIFAPHNKAKSESYFSMFQPRTKLDATYLDWYLHPDYNQGDNSAFYQHMPTLRLLARGLRCVELGVRYGTSTIALLAARPASLFSVDIQAFETHPLLWELAQSENIPFKLTIIDDLLIEIPDCDLLFIDTLHTYTQLSKELALHAHRSTKYIVFHDIVSFGERNEDPADTAGPGLLPAIMEFLQHNPQWKIASFYFNNNGLLILERRTPRFMD